MKQKLFLLLTALLCSVGAWSADYTVTYGTGTGSFTATNDAGTWASRWESTATNPKVTLSTTANNIQVSSGNIYSGASGCTYTITAQSGYVITGYTITGKALSNAQTLTPTEGGEAVTFETSGTSTLTVSGLSASSTSFAQSTPNKGITISSFVITLTEDPSSHWLPSLSDDMLITACTKVTNGTLNTATAADDNSHWYVMTQVRGGESAMFDNGSAPRRAATTYTADYFVGKSAVENAAYLIRFIETESDGVYNIEFATGNFISGSLTSVNEANAGSYAVYFTDGASAVAWNLESKSGQRVDNNGAGNGLSFWGSGENTATSGNNIWTLYEATVEVPSSSVQVTYEQYVNGVATGLTLTETALPNSDINVPASFTNGYSTFAYDITTEGTIADADVTIKVNINKKPGLVEALSELSNSKAYTIKCERGTFTVNDGYLANTVRSSYAVNNFAIVSYEGNYYFWSVEAGKFVACNSNTLGDVPVAITMTSLGSGVFKFQGGGFTMNASSGLTTGAVFNTWTTTDAGNTCAIFEADEFDATNVLSAIETFFNTKTLTFSVNVTGTTEAENTRAGKITMTLKDGSVSRYVDAATADAELQYLDATFTATATSYRGYEFTGFSIDGTDYGTSIAVGDLSEVADGATLVANYTASEGNGINLWYDQSDDMSAAYRLPALVRTQSGRIIAFADYRPGKTDVGGGATSIERRYSDDNGETWSTAIRVAQGNWMGDVASYIENSFGDPAVAADNTPGNSGNDVLMICAGGNKLWTNSTYNADNQQAQLGCALWRSSDAGETWSSYTDITPALMQAFVDAGLRAADGSSGIVRVFFSSGKITQSVRKADGASYNRLYSALDVNGGNVVAYSDDFGATWTVLGNQIANSGDEAHVVELPDGAVLLVGKGNSSRWVNVFNYTDFSAATGEWGPTGQWNNTVATSCHGDVEVVEAYDAYGDKNTVVVQTAPMSSNQRRDIQYYFIALPKAEGFSTGDFSTVGGASWTQGMNVTHNWSAYSALLNNGDGTFDILFEDCAAGETVAPKGYSLIYQKNHSIQNITGGQYFATKEQAEAEGVKTPRPGHFYRIKGSASGAYMTATSPVTTTTATDASTIWYFSEDGLVSYSTGLCLDGSAKSLAAVGTSYKAAIDPSTYHEGKYTVRTNGYYSYDKETNNTLDRGTSVNNNERYAWTVEEVTSLPVTVSSLGLATLYSPVALTAPEGVTIYAAAKDEADSYIHFDEVEAVEAGTGVLVEAEAGTYDFTVESNDSSYESDLVGSVLTLPTSSFDATVYTLQSGPAFKQYTGTNVTGFRSHIETEAEAGVKAFDVIFDDATGLKNLKSFPSGEDLGEAFNLAGQRISVPQKGVNIINGKKILK